MTELGNVISISVHYQGHWSQEALCDEQTAWLPEVERTNNFVSSYWILKLFRCYEEHRWDENPSVCYYKRCTIKVFLLGVLVPLWMEMSRTHVSQLSHIGNFSTQVHHFSKIYVLKYVLRFKTWGLIFNNN